MRASAELHSDVPRELRHTCTAAEIADFYRELERVCADPIANSELHREPTISRYVLRRFSFGAGVEKIAIIHYDGDVVRVLKCRPAKPSRLRKRPEAGAK